MKNKSKHIFKLFALVLCLSFFGAVLGGCVSMPTGIYIENYPTKVIYQIGEVASFDGLKIKTINTDGTHRIVYFGQNEYPTIDTSTSGTKQVVLEKNGFSVSLNYYVASVVVNDSDNIKQIFATLEDGDVVYMRAGNYAPQSADDQRYKDVEVTKKVTIIGDGTGKTKFGGNFLIGASVTQNGYEKTPNFEGVTIRDIGFELDYKIENNLVEYSGPYGNTDQNGAIRFFDTKNLTVLKCSFSGYAFGILGDNADGLSVTKCTFDGMFKSAICVQKETKNTIIAKNVIIDTTQNVVCFDGNQQQHLGAIMLSFDSEGIKGVAVCKNTINRTGFHRGDVVYYDQNSKNMAKMANQRLFELTYINNTSAILFKSSGADNLAVTNVVLSANNLGQALANISFSTNKNDTINASGILFLE